MNWKAASKIDVAIALIVWRAAHATDGEAEHVMVLAAGHPAEEPADPNHPRSKEPCEAARVAWHL